MRARDQAALIGAALAIGAIWIAAILYSCNGQLAAPLDDTYIHLQYARQIAAGNFFAYNTADGYSSGATSFLYALVLAVPALLGLTGDALLWAAHLLNVACYAGSAVLCYRLGCRWRGRATGLAAGTFFLLNGGILWGYGSGMEIALFGFLLLAALSVLTSPTTRHATRNTLVLAALALVRPEAELMVVEAALLLAWGARRDAGAWRRVAPVAGAALVGLLPMGLNLLLTGHVTPNAAEAKLILYRYPEIHPLHVAYIWARSLTLMLGDVFWHGAANAPFFAYAPILAAAGLIRRAASETLGRRPGPFLIGSAWLLTNWALAATLQPVQEYRYIIAGYPLFTVFMAVGMADLTAALARGRARLGMRPHGWAIFLGLATVVVITSVGGLVSKLATLSENSADIYRQQVALGRWIGASLPATARVAINDAGALKYYGNRYQVDLVGLTTNRFAGLRHLGDGAVMDALLAMAPAERPDFFTIYDSWFPEIVALPGFLTRVHNQHLLHNTVTSGDDMPVYQAHWDAVRRADAPFTAPGTDATEAASAKALFSAPDTTPRYIAHLQIPTDRSVTLRVEPAAGSAAGSVDLSEDESGRVAHLAISPGAPVSQTLQLAAGSYRVTVAASEGLPVTGTLRLLTADLWLGLPGQTAGPERRLMDSLELADLAAERVHSYAIETWQWNVYPITILRSAAYGGMPYADSGRSVPGTQRFAVATTPGRDLKIILRYLNATPQRLRVQVDGADAGLWYIPAATGWGETALVLPADRIRQPRTALRFALLPDAGTNPINSFRWWFYQ
ncbi:MAG TPA: hypothetical protein VM536_23590 [Chloroflexia bacterium]|nr:hypothetical protein [Chloroflexia bacterium]